MDKFELQALRDLPIEGVAEQLGLTVKMHRCLCPFHDDKHPSLSFNVRKNTYRCFVCGASGGTIDLVMNYQHIGFKEAIQTLSPALPLYGEGGHPAHGPSVPEAAPFGGRGAFDAERYKRFFEHPYLNAAARHFLFDERHLDPRVIRWCRLTSWRDKQGTNWLQIPYYDTEGKLIGVQNRNLMSNLMSNEKLEMSNSHPVHGPSVPEAAPFGGRGACRFRFPRGSRCSIYNLPVLAMLKPDEPLYITEGASDCWAMLSSGHKAIAIPSATLLKPDDAQQLIALNSRLRTPFHMYPDRDAPGERLFMQLKELLPNIEHHQLPPGCKDYSDYWKAPRPPKGAASGTEQFPRFITK